MSRWTCLYCGRPTAPHLSIGGMAIGPRCAKRMGLTKAAPKNPRIKWHTRQAPVRADAAQADLFEEA